MKKFLILIFIINIASCSSSEQKVDKEPHMNNIYEGDPIGVLTRIENNGRYGYKDEKGNIIVNPIYNQLPEIPWEVMNVKIDENSGLINYRGDTLVDFGKYQLLKIEHSLPLKGRPNKNGVQYFSETADWNMICQKDNFYGMIDRSESILIPIEFERYKYIFGNRYAFYKNGSWSVYDSKGQKSTELNFDQISQIFKYSYFIYGSKNLTGAFDIKTNQDAIGLHEEVIALEKDILGVRDNNEYTILRLNGEQISNLKFDTLYVNHGTNSPLNESMKLKYKNWKIIAWAVQNGKQFLISKEGELVELK